MSFRLSFLSRPQNNGKLSTLEESVSAFSESLRANAHDPNDGSSSLDNSRRARLQISKFTSMRSLSRGSKDGGRKTRHSFGGACDAIDASGRSSLFDELKPAPEVPLEDTHGKEINARKIFVREARKTRMSTFATPKFNEDLRRAMATTSHESKRHLYSSVGTDMTDDLKPVKKKVKFIDVTIREYPIIVGVNPAGSGGPPMTICWEHVSSVDLDIDKYEEARAGNRRKQEEMKRNQDHRKRVLRSLGFSLVEMQKGTKAANIVRNRRRRVNAELYKDSSNAKLEKVKRRLACIATLNYRNRKEKKYLSKSLPNYEEFKAEKWALKNQVLNLSRTSGSRSFLSHSSTASAPAASQ
jgi:hypothetical protein